MSRIRNSTTNFDCSYVGGAIGPANPTTKPLWRNSHGHYSKVAQKQIDTLPFPLGSNSSRGSSPTGNCETFRAIANHSYDGHGGRKLASGPTATSSIEGVLAIQ
jgi:hypothetical protein